MADLMTASVGVAADSLQQFGSALLTTLVPLKGLHDVLAATNTALKGLMGVAGALVSEMTKLASTVAGNLVKAFGDFGRTVGGVGAIFGSLAAVGEAYLHGLLAMAGAAVQAAGGLFQLGLAATPGGFQVFAEVMNYATSVIGQALTPAIAVLMSAILSVVDMLKGPMIDATRAVAEYLVTQFLTNLNIIAVKVLNFGDTLILVASRITAFFTSVFYVVGSAVSSFLNLFGAKNAASGNQAMLEQIREMGKSAKEFGDERKVARDGRASEAADPGSALNAGIKDFGNKFKENFDLVAKGLTAAKSKESNVGFSSIADIAKTIQMQAFQSGIAEKALKAQQDTLAAIQEMNRAIQKGSGPELIGP